MSRPRAVAAEREAEERADDFERVRDAHRAELVEDYVELIADLIDEQGEARAVDLAAHLGVTKATVASAIGKLQRMGLARSEPYRAIFLTEKGRALAESCRARHRLVYEVLVAVGVPANVAWRDAEGIEHHVSPETREAFAAFLRRRESRKD